MKNHHIDNIENKIEEFKQEFTKSDHRGRAPYLEEATKIYNKLVKIDDTEILDKIADIISNNINKKDATGRSILFHAVANEFEELVEYLFDTYKDLDPHTKDNMSLSVLEVALNDQNHKILKLIADKVDDINKIIFPPTHSTALHECFRHHHFQSAITLLQNPKVNVNLHIYGLSAYPIHLLIIQAKYMNAEEFKTILELIIQRKIDIALHDPNKMYELLTKNNRYQIFIEFMNDIIKNTDLDQEYIDSLKAWIKDIQNIEKDVPSKSLRDTISNTSNNPGKIPSL